jgi:WD40 repeat protein
MKGRSISDLNRDYLEAATRAEALGLEEGVQDRLAAYQRFLERNGHRLGPFPQTLREVMLAEPGDSLVRADALADLEGQRWRPGRTWFRRFHPPPTETNPALRRTIPTGRWVTAVACLEREGRPLALTACGAVLRLYDLATGQRLRELVGHTDVVRAVALSGDSRHALSGSDDRTLRWWNLETGACLHTLPGHTGEVNAVALSSDARHALSGSGDETLRWWDLETGACLLTLQGHTAVVRAVALSSDSRHALSGSDDRTLRWWDLNSGTCLHTLPGHTGWVTAVALSSDSRHALSGSDDRTLRWWDLNSGTCLLTLQGHTAVVRAVALSSDSRHALSGSDDHTLRWWDLHEGKCIAVFTWDYPMKSFALSPQGAGGGYRAVAGDSAGNVLIFHLIPPTGA